MTLYQKEYAGQKVCCTCVHFCQHYSYGESPKRYRLVFAGHCIYPRIKFRRPDQSCERWRGREKEPASSC